jgi:NADH-quinone oxidoreductase subunit A
MIQNWLLSPPIALPVLLLAVGAFSLLMRGLRVKGPGAAGMTKPYACGEEQSDAVWTDYGAFFPFAFFFTILHVSALTITSVPMAAIGAYLGTYLLAGLYLLAAVTALSILYRS